MPLQEEAFQAIVARLRLRAPELEEMTRTRSSFEEWVNWEAFLACRPRRDWRVIPKPSYADWNVPELGNGDLSIHELTGSRQELLAEVVLFHDGNRNDKWLAKAQRDIEKLTALGCVKDVPLLLVMVASLSEIGTHGRWVPYLRQFGLWGSPSTLSDSIAYPGGGSLTVRGFDLRTGGRP